MSAWFYIVGGIVTAAGWATYALVEGWWLALVPAVYLTLLAARAWQVWWWELEEDEDERQTS